MKEREVKLAAGDDFRLPDLSDLIGGVTAIPRPDEQPSTVYWDSGDLRLVPWG